MNTVGIYNGFPFHYEMFGYIIEYSKSINHGLIIYTNMSNDLGWLQWYKNFFNEYNFVIESLDAFDPNKLSLLFLVTDDDPAFKDEWFYKIKIPIICIDHDSRHRRTVSKYNVGTRPFPKRPFLPYAIPSFSIVNKSKKINLLKTFPKILAVVGSTQLENNDWKVLRKICEYNPDHELHIFARGIPKEFDSLPIKLVKNQEADTALLIDTLSKSRYVLVLKPIDSKFIEDCMNGIIPLAFSTGCCIVMPEEMNKSYKFKSVITYCQSDPVNKSYKLPEIHPTGDVYKDFFSIVEHRDFIFTNISCPNPPMYEDEYKIPKNIHMVWYDSKNPECKKVPDKNNIYIQTWKIYNPTYHLHIWYNKEINDLLNKIDPEINFFFNSIQTTICKCDFIRFIIVFIFGGLYIDIDFFCTRPVDQLLNGKTQLFFRELPEHESGHGQLCNGFFASSKRTDFVRGWILAMMKNFYEPKTTKDVMYITGPIALYKYFEQNPIILDNPCLIMPYTSKQIISNLCQNMSLDDTYAITLWNDGSGWGSSSSGFSLESLNPFIYILIIIIAVVVLIMMRRFTISQTAVD